MCCGIAGPVHSRTWPTLPCRRLRAVTHGLICPLHPACRAAPPVPYVWCRTAWCSAPHCTVCALLHCCCGQGAVGSVTHCQAAWGLWAVEILLPHCVRAVGSGTPAAHCLPPLGQWTGHLLQYTAALPGAVGSGTPATHCATAWGQWAVDLLQRTASLPGGSGQWDFCNALLHCLGAGGSGSPAMHCLNARGRWADELLQ